MSKKGNPVTINTRELKFLDSTRDLSKIKELNLSGHKISTLPNLFGNLTKLKTLNFKVSSFPDILQSFGQLSNLRFLLFEDPHAVRFHHKLAHLLRKNGFRIFYQSREILEPYGDDYETVTYNYFIKKRIKKKDEETY